MAFQIAVEAPEDLAAASAPKPLVKYGRRVLKPWRNWLETMLYLEDWG